jgi:NADPH:quinone reductase-like Zn-dependent oxidoreductase
MQAAIRERYGSPDVVTVREVARPTAKGATVVVRVVVASLNRVDLDLIEPRPQVTRLFLGLRGPRNHRLGVDVAGVVEAVGPDVTRFKPGDRVFADLYPFGSGSFAEYAGAPERAFLPIPPGMSFETAATLPHSGTLAMQGLRRRNGRTLRPGDQVLIDGASGNTGPFAVQVAKALGAEVTATCSPAKLDFVRSLGPDHVLDYTKVDYTRAAERYDWILDADSHHPLFRCRRALKPGGTYVTLGGAAWPLLVGLTVGPLVSLVTSRWAGLMLWWKPFRAEDIAALAALIADGKVVPAIDRRYPLSEVPEALRYLDDKHAKGKVLITVSEP